MTNRRHFVAAAAAAALAGVKPAAGGGALCTIQTHYTAGNGINFNSLNAVKGNCAQLPALPVIERPLLSSLQNQPERLAKLVNAYKELASRVNDPTGLLYQAKWHQYMCSMNVHDTWAFLIWHRAFLYFHERILAKILGEDFRLPIWDWETSPKVPTPWLQQDVAPSLVSACPRLPSLNFAVNDCRLQAWLFSNTFEEFVGWKGKKGNAVQGAHNDVHSQLGGAIRNLETAAADPLFYAHHGNVDRYWWHWHRQLGKQPTDKRFWEQKFNFYDENGQSVCVCADQFREPEMRGYCYATPVHPPLSLNDLDSIPIDSFLAPGKLWDVVRAAISWLSGQDYALMMASVAKFLLLLPGIELKSGLEFGTAELNRLRQTLARSELAKLLESKAVSFPVRITGTVPTIETGKYYSVGLEDAGVKNPTPIVVGGFGIFSHPGVHSGDVMATGCFGKDALSLLLAAMGNVSVVYGLANASGEFNGKPTPMTNVQWDFLDVKEKLKLIPTLL